MRLQTPTVDEYTSKVYNNKKTSYNKHNIAVCEGPVHIQPPGIVGGARAGEAVAVLRGENSCLLLCLAMKLGDDTPAPAHIKEKYIRGLMKRKSRKNVMSDGKFY